MTKLMSGLTDQLDMGEGEMRMGVSRCSVYSKHPIREELYTAYKVDE
jgi:hypothetical protein